LGETKPVSGEEHLRRSPDGAVGFLRPIQASSPQSLRDSRLKAGEILIKGRRFLPTDAIRAEKVLEILGFRGWENPAKRSKCRTGWAPSTESRRFLEVRPAEGEEIFPFVRKRY